MRFERVTDEWVQAHRKHVRHGRKSRGWSIEPSWLRLAHQLLEHGYQVWHKQTATGSRYLRIKRPGTFKLAVFVRFSDHRAGLRRPAYNAVDGSLWQSGVPGLLDWIRNYFGERKVT